MLRGVLIGESLRVGATLEGVPLQVNAIRRTEVSTVTAIQQPQWTLLEFTAPDEEADRLAVALTKSLAPGPWYCDFRTDTETFVVFAGHIFHYQRGDADGVAEAQQYARSVGIPDEQVDWAD